MSRHAVLFTHALFALLFGGANVVAQTPQYTIHDLGVSPSFQLEITGINRNGAVVGYTRPSSSPSLAFRTQPNSPINLPGDYIGTLGGSSSWAMGINGAGQVVGYSTTSSGETHGFRTAPNAAINPSTDDLGSLGGPPDQQGMLTQGYGINDSGQTTGASQVTNGSHAFRTGPNSAIHPSTDDIPYGGQYNRAQGMSINSAGDVLGEYETPVTLQPFVASADGTITTITQFMRADSPERSFTGINDHGQVVGNDGSQLSVWQSGTLTALSDCGDCAPTGINNNLQVVGVNSPQDQSSVNPFLYSSGNTYNLNNLIPAGSGWVLYGAAAINDQGQIIGYGTLNGDQHIFRLDPVPTMGGGSISLVQSASASGSTVNPLSIQFPSANTQGNLIVAFVRMSTTNQPVSVTDSAGNTYIDAVSQSQAADGHQVHVFYASKIASGANTVKATFSGTNNHPFLAVYEYTGVITLDRIAAAQGSSASPSSGATPTTSSANELVFAATGLPASYTGTVSAGSGFTILKQDTGTSRAADEGEIVSATGSFTGAFSLSSSANWTAVVATFSGGASPNPPHITTSSLSNGTQDTAYSATLAAAGGATPYSWSITTGTLPAGLSLNANTGAISGTPTASGTSNFTVQVTDATSQTDTRGLSITINPGGGSGPIALVQSTFREGSGFSSISVPFSTANTRGNLIIAFVRMSTTTQTVSVSDSAGNIYADAVSQVQAADGHQVHIFYAANIAGGANTVTATFSGSNNHPWLALYEYSGVSALDRTAAAQGSNAFPNSGATSTTSSANELVFAAAGLPASYTGTPTAGTGFTLAQQDTGTSRAANEATAVTSTGSFSGTFNLNAAANWTAVIATFATAGASDSSYQFTVLAKQGDTFGGQSLLFPAGAGINASGTIVYTAAYVCGPMAQSCEDIFQTTLSNLGSSPTLVTNDGGGTPRIDDHGTILFACSGGSLCTQSGVVAKPGDTTGGNGPISHIDDWAISPGGDIVFMANWQHANSDGTYQLQYGLLTPSALFVAGCESTEAGETTKPCTGPSGNIIDGTKMLAVGVPLGFNPNGDWAFYCSPDPGMPFQGNSPTGLAVCTREHILVQAGSVIGGNTLTSAFPIGSTSSGTLVFTGDGQSNGSRAIYSLNPTGVMVQPGDTVAGHHIDAIYSGVLSSGGTLAFLAHFTDSGGQGSGVFIESATGSSLVLKQGDTVNGITVTNVNPNAVRDDGTVVLTISGNGAAAVVAQPVLSR